MDNLAIRQQISISLAQIANAIKQISVAVNPPPAAHFSFIVGGKEVAQMQMQDNQKLAVSIAVQDVDGNPTVLDPASVLVWDVDNAQLASVAPAADGMSAVVSPSGQLGSFNVQLSIAAVNAQPAIQGSLAVTVVASGASQVVLSGVAS
jgi:hypothetical protein